jgi:hypothetical protein
MPQTKEGPTPAQGDRASKSRLAGRSEATRNIAPSQPGRSTPLRLALIAIEATASAADERASIGLSALAASLRRRVGLSSETVA